MIFFPPSTLLIINEHEMNRICIWTESSDIQITRNYCKDVNIFSTWGDSVFCICHCTKLCQVHLKKVLLSSEWPVLYNSNFNDEFRSKPSSRNNLKMLNARNIIPKVQSKFRIRSMLQLKHEWNYN